MTHLESETCPFKGDNNPIGMFGTCCSFRGNMVALYLLAMGFGSLVLRLYEDKDSEESREFAGELRAAVTMLLEGMAKAEATARREGRIPARATRDGTNVKVPGVGWEFSIERAFEVIEDAALWHEKVAVMHCGVHADY